jgi:Cu+-exporting ATPase
MAQSQIKNHSAPGVDSTAFAISGMTCANCARHVTEAIQSVPGVQSASVSLEKKNADVRWNSGSGENAPAVVQAVKNAGYEAKEIQNDSCGCHAGHPPKKNRQFNLWLGIFVTAFLMMGEWAFGLVTKPWFQWLSFALAGAVQFLSGAPFYHGAWRQLKIRSSNMDTLVALGSTTAFGYSAWALLSGDGGHLYFMEAAAIITLISLGHYLEARVSEKAGGALKSLMQLAPHTAHRLRSPQATGHSPANQPFDLRTASFSQSTIGNRQSAIEEDVPVAELKIGDQIVLRPGDRVPVDGMVIEGESAMDESSLTGESVPAEKKSGSELFTGTVNLNGRLVMRVTAVGRETALAHVIAAVQRAQTSRADIQRIGDRVSNIFVPVVVAIAIAAGLWWGLAPQSAHHVHEFFAQFLWHAHAPDGIAVGFIIAAAILIIACPCAMGLATPAAIMAGANAASRRGILIRDGVALEKAGKISAILFDKTGTLTSGRPEITAVAVVSPHPPGGGRFEENGVRQLAAALARNSTHPISQAMAKINSEGRVSGLPDDDFRDSQSSSFRISDWREIRGSGIEARLATDSALRTPNSAFIRLGSLRWLKEIGVDVASGQQFISEWSSQGATIIGLAEEKVLLGLFAVRDAVKPNASNVVEQLQRQGLKIYLVTGDNSPTAISIAKQAGIAPENVFAEVRPEQKAEFVKKLQAQGERVAFVGDGINDAPALTQADLGIAVSRASDIAREAADIILLKSEIEAVPEALDLARATLRTIKQNLFWAFFYNALGVPLAALGFISPIFCAAAMGVSDLIVIGNALRLLRRQK